MSLAHPVVTVSQAPPYRLFQPTDPDPGPRRGWSRRLGLAGVLLLCGLGIAAWRLGWVPATGVSGERSVHHVEARLDALEGRLDRVASNAELAAGELKKGMELLSGAYRQCGEALTHMAQAIEELKGLKAEMVAQGPPASTPAAGARPAADARPAAASSVPGATPMPVAPAKPEPLPPTQPLPAASPVTVSQPKPVQHVSSQWVAAPPPRVVTYYYVQPRPAAPRVFGWIFGRCR